MLLAHPYCMGVRCMLCDVDDMTKIPQYTQQAAHMYRYVRVFSILTLDQFSWKKNVPQKRYTNNQHTYELYEATTMHTNAYENDKLEQLRVNSLQSNTKPNWSIQPERDTQNSLEKNGFRWKCVCCVCMQLNSVLSFFISFALSVSDCLSLDGGGTNMKAFARSVNCSWSYVSVYIALGCLFRHICPFFGRVLY